MMFQRPATIVGRRNKRRHIQHGYPSVSKDHPADFTCIPVETSNVEKADVSMCPVIEIEKRQCAAFYFVADNNDRIARSDPDEASNIVDVVGPEPAVVHSRQMQRAGFIGDQQPVSGQT